MARIIGGIACSHTPTIGFAVDHDKRKDPAWAPIFDGFEPVRIWLKDKKPDALFVVFNDHVTSFFFDHYSAFALGIDDEYGVADEGGGRRDLPPLEGHADLARHIGASLMADEFDMSFFQKKPLDHGCFSPLSVLCDLEDGKWPFPIVPLACGVLQFPIPSARRCFKLGQALRRAIESYPEDINVAILATGGLSHQVHGARAGFNNVDWDHRFLELIEKDPEALTRLTVADFAELGGFEGAEVIMWLIMRGALPANVKKLHEFYYLPSMTGIATAIYENEVPPLPKAKNEDFRRHIAHQLSGVHEIEGTHPFTHEVAHRTYRLNKFLHDLVNSERRMCFLKDPEATFVDAGLTDLERDLIRRRDWDGMIQYGVQPPFYVPVICGFTKHVSGTGGRMPRA